jgi:allophanate hydrolase
LGGDRFSAKDVFRAQYALHALIKDAQRAMAPLDALLMPTVPTVFTREAEASDRSINDKLGVYTRFANFLGWPVLALPAGMREDGLPFGLSLAMREGEDRCLDRIGLALERVLKSGMGLRLTGKPPAARSVNDASAPPLPGSVRLAVVGAHLRGEALNHELLALRARFVRATRTSATYKLYALPNTKPLKPGLTRVASGGSAIEIELWDLSVQAFGSFVSKIPSPLGIGTLECEDGERVKGFLCEAVALQGAEDISRFGGFKAYLSSLHES